MSPLYRCAERVACRGRAWSTRPARRRTARAAPFSLAEGAPGVLFTPHGVTVHGSGHDAGPAEQVAGEIRAAGGSAVANYDSVAHLAGGERMVRQCVAAF